MGELYCQVIFAIFLKFFHKFQLPDNTQSIYEKLWVKPNLSWLTFILNISLYPGISCLFCSLSQNGVPFALLAMTKSQPFVLSRIRKHHKMWNSCCLSDNFKKRQTEKTSLVKRLLLKPPNLAGVFKSNLQRLTCVNLNMEKIGNLTAFPQ